MENEKILISKPSATKGKQNIKMLQTQFSMIINQEIEWKIKRMRQKKIELENKPGKLLAWQLKKRQCQNTINKIKIKDKLIENLKEIRKNF